MHVDDAKGGEYIGADLTDRYATRCKPVDVCGLNRVPNERFAALFWQWTWKVPVSDRGVDASEIGAEIRAARCSMLDAPQALAAVGSRMRRCERELGAAGKTPCALPAVGPFANYIRSSVELFSAIFGLGACAVANGEPRSKGSVGEVYPGYGWRKLAGRPLCKKSSVAGRKARQALLEMLGVQFPDDCELSHDRLDACLGALTAAASDNAVRGATVRHVGDLLSCDGAGIWREGKISVLELTDPELIAQRDTFFAGNAELVPHARPKQDASRFAPISSRVRSGVTEDSQLPDLKQTEPAQRAEELFDWCIVNLEQNIPVTLTYKAAHALLRGLQPPYPAYGQAFGDWAKNVAENTQRQELPNLGTGALDSFIVRRKDGKPGEGHWDSANYEREDWERLLGNADLLHIVKDRLVRMTFS